MILKIENSTLAAGKQLAHGKDTVWTLTCYPNTPSTHTPGLRAGGQGCLQEPGTGGSEPMSPRVSQETRGCGATRVAITAMLGIRALQKGKL